MVIAMTEREPLPAGAATSSRRAEPRIAGKDYGTPCAARVELERIASAKSQQFDRPLMTLWRTGGVHADYRHLTGETRTRQGRGTDRPPYGKIKAAQCGPVGRGRSAAISASWRDVHFGHAMCNFGERAQNQGLSHIASGHREKSRLSVHIGHSIFWLPRASSSLQEARATT
jgi:hypothetical protein